jgi:ribosomal protein S27AE
VSLIPCDACHRRVQEKLCQATWAWYSDKGERVAYRQRLCTACYTTSVLPFDKPLDFDSLSCPGCGISTEHDMAPVYCTVYIPGMGREQFEFPTCPACATQMHAVAINGGVLLEDRQRVEGPGGGPSTPTTRESYWSQIGIRARGDEP